MINHENHTALKFESSEKQKKSLDSEDARSCLCWLKQPKTTNKLPALSQATLPDDRVHRVHPPAFQPRIGERPTNGGTFPPVAVLCGRLSGPLLRRRLLSCLRRENDSLARKVYLKIFQGRRQSRNEFVAFGLGNNQWRSDHEPVAVLSVRCSPCIAPGSLDTSLSHAAGLSDIAVCHA